MPNSKPPGESKPGAAASDWLDTWIARAKKGEEDPDGFEVARIVAKNAELRFLLYLTTDDQLRMNCEREMSAGVQDAVLSVARETDGDPALIKRFNSRKANAIHLFLRGETANSVAALRQLAADIAVHKKHRARGPYVGGALAVCFVLMVLGGALRAFWWSDIEAFWRELVCVVAFGALGGTLSCVVGSGSVADSAPVGLSAFLGGALRVVVGILFAAAASVLMHADLVLSFLKNLGLYGVSAAALVTGFSESFVPDAMKTAAKPIHPDHPEQERTEKSNPNKTAKRNGAKVDAHDQAEPTRQPPSTEVRDQPEPKKQDG